MVVRYPNEPRQLLQVLMDYNDIVRKQYLGGFRHTVTGQVYHHASSQTPKQPRNIVWPVKYTRQTQTVQMKTRSQQSVREACTQMDRPDCLTDTTFDVVISPRPYIDADTILMIREEATRTIQRYARGWLGRRRANYLRRLKEEADLFNATMVSSSAVQWRRALGAALSVRCRAPSNRLRRLEFNGAAGSGFLLMC